MYWFSEILDTIFPDPFSSDFFHKLPPAPSLPHTHFFALYDYHHPHTRKLIYHIKKYKSIQRDKKLAENIYEHLLGYITDQQQFSYFLNPIIIIIPLHNDSKKQRSFNQCENIAKIFSKKCNGKYHKNLILKIKQTKKQALVINKQERFTNIKNSFSIEKTSLKDVFLRDIIIIDDLITTGATMQEAIKVLKKAGARNIIGISIAH